MDEEIKGYIVGRRLYHPECMPVNTGTGVIPIHNQAEFQEEMQGERTRCVTCGISIFNEVWNQALKDSHS